MSIPVAVSVNVEAGFPQRPYTVPNGQMFTGNIRLTNRNTTEVRVRVAICKLTVPSAEEFIEYDAVIPGNEPLEDTGLILTQGESFYISSDVSSVSVRIHGIQEAI